MRYFIGIDPGKTGAIAMLRSDAFCGVWDWGDMKFLEVIKAYRAVSHALIERQNTRPGQGVASSGKIMYNFGWWEGLLLGIGIPYETISARMWQKVMFQGVSQKGRDRKEISMEVARKLFPGIAGTLLARKIDHGRADAILIAEFLRRKCLHGSEK